MKKQWEEEAGDRDRPSDWGMASDDDRDAISLDDLFDEDE